MGRCWPLDAKANDHAQHTYASNTCISFGASGDPIASKCDMKHARCAFCGCTFTWSRLVPFGLQRHSPMSTCCLGPSEFQEDSMPLVTRSIGSHSTLQVLAIRSCMSLSPDLCLYLCFPQYAALGLDLAGIALHSFILSLLSCLWQTFLVQRPILGKPAQHHHYCCSLCHNPIVAPWSARSLFLYDPLVKLLLLRWFIIPLPSLSLFLCRDLFPLFSKPRPPTRLTLLLPAVSTTTLANPHTRVSSHSNKPTSRSQISHQVNF